MARFKRNYVVFPRGYAKCVGYDTMVFTKDGIMEIGELFDYKKTQDEEIIITHDFSMLNRYGELEKSDKGIISGYKKTKKIKTEYGYEIETSENHPLLVMNEKGELIYKKSSELKIGDCLPINRKNDVWGNKYISYEKIKEYVDNVGMGIHKDILLSLKTVVSTFIKCLFDKSAIMKEDRVSFYTESERLSKQIQIVLLNFGIISKRTKTFDRQCNTNIYNILIENEYFHLYMAEIHNKELKNINSLDYFYTCITEIKDDENYVCDIQMSKTHSFIGNGFINHNTFLQTLFAFHTSVFYSDNTIALTAQTLQNASSLIKDKYSEIMKFFPMLQNETIEKKNRFADNLSEVYWKSGSRIDSMANAQSSKGQRRKRIICEEACQMSDTVFSDCIEPICNIPRRSIGKMAIVNPLELNSQINFFTTSWYRGCQEFERSLLMCEEMVNLKGVFILGSDFELACSYGRGEPKSAILEKKERLNPTAFAMNYLSWWVGASDGMLIPIDKVMAIRNVTKADLKWDKKSEVVLGVDVARSNNSQNNQSSVVVLKLIKNKNGKLINVICTNIINYPSTVNFQTLAINLMKLKILYNAKAVVVDSNGLGGNRPS